MEMSLFCNPVKKNQLNSLSMSTILKNGQLKLQGFIQLFLH